MKTITIRPPTITWFRTFRYFDIYLDVLPSLSTLFTALNIILQVSHNIYCIFEMFTIILYSPHIILDKNTYTNYFGYFWQLRPYFVHFWHFTINFLHFSHCVHWFCMISHISDIHTYIDIFDIFYILPFFSTFYLCQYIKLLAIYSIFLTFSLFLTFFILLCSSHYS